MSQVAPQQKILDPPLHRLSLLGFFLHINIYDLPKPPQRVPSLLTHILNALAYQDNTTCRQNSKMREEDDVVTYENKHHVEAYQNTTTCRQNSKMREEEDVVTYENKHHIEERDINLLSLIYHNLK